MSQVPSLIAAPIDRRSRSALLFGSLALALVPKCPLCIYAYFGAVGAASAATSVWNAWLAPLTAGWLIFTVIALAWKSGGRRGPALLGVAAASAILLAKFAFDNRVVLFAGMAALFGAAVWRAWPRHKSAEPCAE